jgi:hypothetical protein
MGLGTWQGLNNFGNVVSGLLALMDLQLNAFSNSQKLADVAASLELETSLDSNFSKQVGFSSLMQAETTSITNFDKKATLLSFTSLTLDTFSNSQKLVDFDITNAIESDLSNSFNKIPFFAANVGMELELLSIVERVAQVGEFFARMSLEVNSNSTISKTANLESLENDLNILSQLVLNKEVSFEILNNLSLSTASELAKSILLSSDLQLDLELLQANISKVTNLQQTMPLELEELVEFTKQAILAGNLSLETLISGVFDKSSDIQASQSLLLDLSANVFGGVLLNVRSIYNFVGIFKSVKVFSGNVQGSPLVFNGVVND